MPTPLRTILLAAAGATLSALALPAQWQSNTVMTSYSTVYDPVQQRVLAFDSSGTLRQWTRNHWQEVDRSGPALTRSAAAFDPVRNELVVVDLSGGPTFALGPNGWRTAATTVPPARGSSALAFHGPTGTLILHASFALGGGLTDTWQWNGSAWTQVASNGPTGLGGAMAPGPNGDLILHTIDAPFTPQGAWAWNGSTWNPIPQIPSMLRNVRLMYDSVANRTLAFGGTPAAPLGPYEVWEYDGVSWTRPAGSAAGGSLLAPGVFDALNNRAFFFSFESATTWSRTAGWRTASTILSGSITEAQLVYDRARDELVALNERSGFLFRGDGLGWHRVLTGGVGPRTQAVMAYDEARDEIVHFGGLDVATPSAATSVLTSGATMWASRSPMTQPPARYASAAAYDVARQQVVMFGGNDGNSPLGDTWLWDGAQWVQAAPQNNPPASDGHAMCYDRLRQRVVLWGADPSAVWEWDGVDWSAIPASGPVINEMPGLAFDELRERVLLHGGQSPSSTLTWEWDGDAWSRLIVASSRDSFATKLAFHAGTGRTVRIGAAGTGELLGGATGTPCQTAVLHELTVDTDRPGLGSSLTLRVNSAIASPLAFFLFGGDVQTPRLLLSQFGLTGCALELQTDGSTSSPVVSGVATHVLSVPNDPRLIGYRFIAQSVVVNPSANPAGLATSNAVVVRVAP